MEKDKLKALKQILKNESKVFLSTIMSFLGAILLLKTLEAN